MVAIMKVMTNSMIQRWPEWLYFPLTILWKYVDHRQTTSLFLTSVPKSVKMGIDEVHPPPKVPFSNDVP